MRTAKELFHSTYLPELITTIGHFWNDQNLFETPEIEMEAITAAATRGCTRLQLSYPESFLLAAASHCPELYLHRLLVFFYRAPDLDTQATLLSAYLLMQYVDEVQVPVRIAMSRNISSCGALTNNAISIPLASRNLLSVERRTT